jgi:hypothetical protein
MRTSKGRIHDAMMLVCMSYSVMIWACDWICTAIHLTHSYSDTLCLASICLIMVSSLNSGPIKSRARTNFSKLLNNSYLFQLQDLKCFEKNFICESQTFFKIMFCIWIKFWKISCNFVYFFFIYFTATVYQNCWLSDSVILSLDITWFQTAQWNLYPCTDRDWLFQICQNFGS